MNFGGGAAGGGGGFRTMTEDEMREMFGDADPFSDFFHTFFGGRAAARRSRARGRGARARPRPGRAATSSRRSSSTLEDAYHGATRRLSIKHDGHARTVDVRIPAGVGDGSRVRVAGEGEHGAGGAKSGDLYLRIRLAPHPTFERKGQDLYTRVPVPLTTAVLGGEAEVTTLGGKSLRLKIPPTTQNGQVFRLKGHGMPTVGKADETGDLYATVDVQLPRELTPEQRAHFEALQTAGSARRPPHRAWLRERPRNSRISRSARGERHDEHQQVHRKSPGSGRSRRSELAEQSSHPQVEPEHLLVALVEQRDGIVPEVLRKMNADPGGHRPSRAGAARQDPAGVRRRAARPVAAAASSSPTWPRPKPSG